MTEEYSWTLKAYENRGNLWLEWDTNAPFRAQQGQVHVYTGNDFPANPHDETWVAWAWDTQQSPLDTNLPWGTGWHCAWIAEKPDNGPYTYLVKVITDSTMGPNTARK